MFIALLKLLIGAVLIIYSSRRSATDIEEPVIKQATASTPPWFLIDVQNIPWTRLYTGVSYVLHSRSLPAAKVSWCEDKTNSSYVHFYIEANENVCRNFEVDQKDEFKKQFTLITSGRNVTDSYIIVNLGKLDSMLCRLKEQEGINRTQPSSIRMIGFYKLNLESPPDDCLWYPEQQYYPEIQQAFYFTLKNKASGQMMAEYQDKKLNITELRLFDDGHNPPLDKRQMFYEVAESVLQGTILQLKYDDDAKYIRRHGRYSITQSTHKYENSLNETANYTTAFNIVLSEPGTVSLLFSFSFNVFHTVSFGTGLYWAQTRKQLEGRYNFQDSTQIVIPLEPVTKSVQVSCPPETTCTTTFTLTSAKWTEMEFKSRIEVTMQMIRLFNTGKTLEIYYVNMPANFIAAYLNDIQVAGIASANGVGSVVLDSTGYMAGELILNEEINTVYQPFDGGL